MKRNIVSVSALVAAAFFGFIVPSGLSSATNNTHDRSSAKHAMFNPSTIETVQGKVAGITTWKGKKAKSTTEWLSLKTDRGTMPILLGPASYVNKEKVKINKGDNISVTGSRVTIRKRSELVATEIKVGDQTLDLRKSDGTPLWSAKTTQGK